MSFNQSESVCHCYNGHLARPDTRKINAQIALRAPVENENYQLMWLGYSQQIQDGPWVDSNGDFPPVQNWGTSYIGTSLPDNTIRTVNGTLETQDCVTINYRMRTLWDDEWCSSSYYGACQTHRSVTIYTSNLPLSNIFLY